MGTFAHEPDLIDQVVPSAMTSRETNPLRATSTHYVMVAPFVQFVATDLFT